MYARSNLRWRGKCPRPVCGERAQDSTDNLNSGEGRASTVPSALPRPRARRAPRCRRLCGPPAPAMSPRRGARSLRGNAKMRADLPPGRAGCIRLRYGAIARHPGCDRSLHSRDRLSTARETRLRPLLQCLGKSCAVAVPAGDELEPRDDLLAPQAERSRDLVSAAAGGLHRRQVLLSLFRPGSRHRHSCLSD